MDVVEAVEQRRSIKGFDPKHRMPETQIQRLLELTLLSPTAFNIQHWRFVRIQDPALRTDIRRISGNQSQVTDASLLLVICMDLKAWDRDPQRYWRNAPERTREVMVQSMRDYYRNNPEAERDEAMRSASLAAMTMMLVAKDMGYDSCPMDGFDFDALARLIRLPADHAICMMVAIGKPARAPYPRAGQLSLDEVLFTDGF